MKKQYYAITTKMIFEKTVLVPVETVKDIYAAIDVVEEGIETVEISLLTEDAEFKTFPAQEANQKGILELSDEAASDYQIIKRNEE